jgi:hypothetical protein
VSSVDLTRYFRRYREAARFVWNTSLVGLGDVELDFADIDLALFRGIMSIKPNSDLSISKIPVVHYPELRVVPRWPTAMFIAHGEALNSWHEAPVSKNGRLLYAGLFDFDWTNGAYRDFEYIRCVDPTKGSAADGNLLLVRANSAKIIFRST